MVELEYPFKKPVPFGRLGQETGQSYSSIRRLVRAGIAPSVAFPNGERIRPKWANRYVCEGLTAKELRRLTEYNLQAKVATT